MSFARDLFLAIHTGLPREAPGSDACTRQALRALPLPKQPHILDIGCGPGAHSLTIADEIKDARITSVDLHPGYLDVLRRRAAELGCAERISTQVGDMKSLQFNDAMFDLLWCEAAVYIMGFEAALADWQRMVKPGGCVGISDLIWTSDKRPDAAVEFWRGYPDMTTADVRRTQIEAAGFSSLGGFVLPDSAWMDEYYIPMQRRIDALRVEHAGNTEAQDVLSAAEAEIRIRESSGTCYGYAFFLMQKR